MGETIIVACKNCNYKKRFFVGISFLYGSTINVINRIEDKKERDLAELAVNEFNAVIKDFYDCIYRCNVCNALYEKKYYKIEIDEKDSITAQYSCQKCGAELEKLKDIENNGLKLLDSLGKRVQLKCPDCGKFSLEYCDGYFEWN